MVAVCMHKEMNNYPAAESHFDHSWGICEPWPKVKYSLCLTSTSSLYS